MPNLEEDGMKCIRFGFVCVYVYVFTLVLGMGP